VLFDDETVNQGTPRAIGVEMMVGEHLYTADPQADGSAPEPEAVFATREVILSAGAFNTPQLLKLSGIGPRDELATHGIEPLVDLPGVGENLQDRYEIGVVFELRGQLSTGSECTFTGTEDDPCFLEWRDRRSGPYTSNGGVVGIIKRSSRTLYDPDLFIFGVPSVFKGYQPGYSQESVGNLDKFTWLILKAHTKNTGSVRLRSANPLERPEINFAYFNDGANGLEDPDLQAMVNGVEFVRDIGRNIEAAMFAPSFGRFDEVFPGPDVAGAEAVAEFVRNEAWGHHASCTAKIGADDDPMAVLDSRFNVRGTDGLRVVDASVFPEIPGFFIAAPIYIVSEKATDVILEDLGESRISANQPVEPGN
jgi:choline dehydrogenase